MNVLEPSLVALYQWTVKECDAEDLIEVWKTLTWALHEEAGSL